MFSLCLVHDGPATHKQLRKLGHSGCLTFTFKFIDLNEEKLSNTFYSEYIFSFLRSKNFIALFHRTIFKIIEKINMKECSNSIICIVVILLALTSSVLRA